MFYSSDAVCRQEPQCRLSSYHVVKVCVAFGGGGELKDMWTDGGSHVSGVEVDFGGVLVCLSHCEMCWL